MFVLVSSPSVDAVFVCSVSVSVSVSVVVVALVSC